MRRRLDLLPTRGNTIAKMHDARLHDLSIAQCRLSGRGFWTGDPHIFPDWIVSMATGVHSLRLRLATKFVRSVPVTTNNMEN